MTVAARIARATEGFRGGFVGGAGVTVVVDHEAVVSTAPITAAISTPAVSVVVNEGNEVVAEVDQS
jgi:hypothetical protein